MGGDGSRGGVVMRTNAAAAPISRTAAISAMVAFLIAPAVGGRDN